MPIVTHNQFQLGDRVGFMVKFDERGVTAVRLRAEGKMEGKMKEK